MRRIDGWRKIAGVLSEHAAVGAHALGLTLDDIRELVRLEQLRTPDECRRVATLLRERIEAIDQKVAELRAFRRQLALSLKRCEEADGETCPVVLSLSPAKAR